MAKRRKTKGRMVKCGYCHALVAYKNYEKHLNQKCYIFACKLFYDCVKGPREDRTCIKREGFQCPAKLHNWCDGEDLLIDVLKYYNEMREAVNKGTVRLHFNVQLPIEVVKTT